MGTINEGFINQRAENKQNIVSMSEDLDIMYESTKESMEAAIDHLKSELQKVRTGTANPSMVSSLMVSYYGAPTPMNQVANVTASDARTLVIQPWEKSVLSDIEKSIFEANLGVTPMNDGEVVRISIPPLTEERRRSLAKNAKQLAEDAKVSVRNARREMMEEIKKAVKDGFPEDAGKRWENKTQGLTDSYSEKIDALYEVKEKDIMTI